MKKVKLQLSSHSYPILVGQGDKVAIRATIQKSVGAGRLFVVYDANFYALYRGRIGKQINSVTRNVIELVIPGGEKAKTTAMVNHLHNFFLDNGIKRDDLIVACGGGTISDLVGYVAATTLRGIRWGVISTTLLGMVDAAIGGKTGINHRNGKNLIGAFWQPSFVICNVEHLHTLPERQMIAGLGEVLKYGGLIGSAMIDKLTTYFDKGDLLDQKILTDIIFLSAACKADIVARDEREQKLRMVLNLGHTFAHGIEKALGYGRLMHGEAVALGLLAMLNLSCEMKPSREKHLADYRSLVKSFIRLVPKRKIDAGLVLRAMQHDKKRVRSGQKYVLLERPGKPIITDNIDLRLVRRALTGALDDYRNRS